MSTFNSADIAAFTGGVWVFCEQRQGKMMSTSYELISEGRKLADERGTKLYGLLLGDGIEGIAKELGGYGADGVYVCDHPLLKEYTTDAYTKVICDVVEEFKPEVLLIGATNIGRDLGPPLRGPPAHRPDRRLHPPGHRHGHLCGLPAQQLHLGRGQNQV